MRRLAVLCFVTSCMTPVMKFGEGKTAKQAQRETMSDFTPARLVVDTKWQGEVTTRTIRVYADDQYRTQNVKWQQTFDGTVELANVVLTPLFGLRLVAQYRKWDRNVPGSTLANDLEALAAVDPGTDVFADVGLTSALPLVSATFDELGIAQLGGRHLMVRGYADLEERKLYEDAFRDLMPEERELALEQRRHHKTAVVLVHELGHNLGVEHDAEEDVIMSAGYSHRATKLSPRSHEIMLKAIDARLGRGTAKPEDTPAQTAIAENTPAPIPPGSREVLIFYITETGAISYGDATLDDAALDGLFADKGSATELVIKRARKAPKKAVERIVGRASARGLTKVSITLY